MQAVTFGICCVWQMLDSSDVSGCLNILNNCPNNIQNSAFILIRKFSNYFVTLKVSTADVTPQKMSGNCRFKIIILSS